MDSPRTIRNPLMQLHSHVMTRYLNIYPKRMHAFLTVEDVFEGHLVFNLEQYGLLRPDLQCDIRVQRAPVEKPRLWELAMFPMEGIKAPYFTSFADALDRYVFLDLRAAPSMQCEGHAPPAFNLYFDCVFFDMSGHHPVLRKSNPAGAEKKSPWTQFF